VSEVTVGERIVLKHTDGMETCYIGNVEPKVRKGDILQQGQVIGTITDSSLLFQVLREGEPVDPFLYVKGPE
jgi:murein DD-endopeptidase MepM/ murein hydrolase activator NlpD